MTSPDINPAAGPSKFEYRRAPVYRVEHREGSITRIIEEQTARIPSDVFLVASLGSMVVSVFFEFRNDLRKARFFGQWPAPLLIMGVYNKIVKSLGPG
jgi:hypothetical protein